MKTQKDNTEFDLLISFICFILIMLVIVFSSCKKETTEPTKHTIRLVVRTKNACTSFWGVSVENSGSQYEHTNIPCPSWDLDTTLLLGSEKYIMCYIDFINGTTENDKYTFVKIYQDGILQDSVSKEKQINWQYEVK